MPQKSPRRKSRSARHRRHVSPPKKKSSRKYRGPTTLTVAVLCANEATKRNEYTKRLLANTLKIVSSDDVKYDYIDEKRNVIEEVKNDTLYDIVIDENCPNNLEEDVLKFVNKKLVDGGKFIQSHTRTFPTPNFYRDASVYDRRWRVVVKCEAGFIENAKEMYEFYNKLMYAKQKDLIGYLIHTYDSLTKGKKFNSIPEMKSSEEFKLPDITIYRRDVHGKVWSVKHEELESLDENTEIWIEYAKKHLSTFEEDIKNSIEDFKRRYSADNVTLPQEYYDQAYRLAKGKLGK